MTIYRVLIEKSGDEGALLATCEELNNKWHAALAYAVEAKALYLADAIHKEPPYYVDVTLVASLPKDQK